MLKIELKLATQKQSLLPKEDFTLFIYLLTKTKILIVSLIKAVI